ncbi:MAG: hypothetical protein Q4P24_01880 [Rhodobacterales bacterium]|nr:hypothetical protein [Rhodobacterales bacterium]
MKPNFALTFSEDGIRLLHRQAPGQTGSGWTRVGSVALNDEDMAGALAALRRRAGLLDSSMGGAPVCKLVIPNDQIKYLEIEARDGTGAGDPDSAVRAALEGATPYAVEDLEYDWTSADRVIQVAAVALETLAEAENFAQQHGFDAVSYAAIPEGSSFRGEPFFGVTRRAATILPEGTVVERDDTAIHVTGDAQISAAPKDTVTVSSADTGDDTPVASAASEAVASAPPAPKREMPPPLSPPAPGQVPKLAAPAPEPKAAFTTIRATREADAPRVTSPVMGHARTGRLNTTTPLPSSAPPLPSPASDGGVDPARLAELAASLHPDPAERLDRDAAEKARPPAAKVPEASAKRPAPPATASAAGRAPKPRIAADPATRPAPPAREEEKQRLTIFSARQRAVRGKPRFLGLILTAILILFMIGVAAWASLFVEDGLSRLLGGGVDIKLADSPATAEPADARDSGDDEEEAGAAAPLPDRAARPVNDAPADRPKVAALPDQPAPLAPSEALSSYAATGIWQMAPEAPDIPVADAPLQGPVDVLADGGVNPGAPAAMPRRTPDGRDTRPETPVDPPPPGTRYDFDDRGLVRATPDGAITPQGVRVFAGLPPATPPRDMAQTLTVTATATDAPDLALEGTRPHPRPASISAAQPALAEPETQEDGAQEDREEVGKSVEQTALTAKQATEDLAFAPSLALLRPQIRPKGMTAAATLQAATSDSAAPLVDSAALTRAIAEASTADIADTAAADPEAEAGDEGFDGATAQAVTASLTPLRRPGSFEATIARAEPAAKAAPAVQPRAISIPSKASVSKQATVQDAINLRKVNLIGVYGSTSSRRALVRLGNGRFQKVRVGDSLDGGQVAAIGESELRYIKRGKNMVLRIPQG